MKIALHDRLHGAQIIEATYLVVYDKFDNPVTIAVEPHPGLIITATADHPEFNQLLQRLGIDTPVVVRDAQIITPTFRH